MQRMDKRKTKSYREKLLARREGLVGQVQAAEAYSRERDAEATQDPADMAANAYTKERMEEGKYGKCIHCGQPIQEKRLEAVPWARYCLRCADLNERGLLTREEE